jgi:hypothetical protein
MTLPFTLRPSQIEILNYHGGKLGISAVPGSGKTFTLSALAAQIITSGVSADQDVLIVMLVNSAVDNFAARIGKMVETRGSFHLGYRIRTLLDSRTTSSEACSPAGAAQIVDERGRLSGRALTHFATFPLQLMCTRPGGRHKRD